MNATEIKTRHGLILQGLVRQSLSVSGVSHRENWQYDPACERPDFTIPDSDKPKYAIEVHQTDRDNSFLMKLMRSLNAVAEAKAAFGHQLVSVNVLFGDPVSEIPKSSLDSFCSFFDLTIIPRSAPDIAADCFTLEKSALSCAEDPELTVESALACIITSNSGEIAKLGTYLSTCLSQAEPKKELIAIWKKEQRRLSQGKLEAPKLAGETHYKRWLLESLFISDADFSELLMHRDASQLPVLAQQHLITLGVAEERKTIKGTRICLKDRLANFLREAKSAELRGLCKERLDKEENMKWFFEDIRNVDRRISMARKFWHIVENGKQALRDALAENMSSDAYADIEHRRCWIADLIGCYLGVSNNSLNSALISQACDPLGIGNPFRQMTYKGSRLMAATATHNQYIDGVGIAFEALMKSQDVKIAGSVNELAERLLALRLDGAVKLQKLNPLFISIESVAKKCGFTIESKKYPSLLSDLAGGKGPLGKFSLLTLCKGKCTVLLNALYIGDGYGSDHKADEWSARCRAIRYKVRDGKIGAAENLPMMFVADGVWADKSIQKLISSGWDKVVRLPELESLLIELAKKQK